MEDVAGAEAGLKERRASDPCSGGNNRQVPCNAASARERSRGSFISAKRCMACGSAALALSMSLKELTTYTAGNVDSEE